MNPTKTYFEKDLKKQAVESLNRMSESLYFQIFPMVRDRPLKRPGPVQWAREVIIRATKRALI